MKISGRPDAEQHPRLGEVPEVERVVDVGQLVHRRRDDQRAGHDEILGLDPRVQPADHEHHHERDDPARREHEARPGRGVAEVRLHEERQELGGREQDRAGREHHQEAGAELARRRPCARRSPDWRRVTSHGIMSANAIAQIAVLTTMNREPNQSCSSPRSSTTSSVPKKVEIRRKPTRSNRPPLVGPVRRQEVGDQRDGREADRDVDPEAPAPRDVVGEPAAERRPDDRRDDDRDAEQGESLATLLGRERVREDGLRDRHHAAARQALQEPEQEQGVEIPGLGAKERAQGEEAEAGEEETSCGRASGQETGLR